ncbi:MAG: hypothetical protein AAFZ92_00485 [Pseudomonadota bacterium]
MIDYRQILIILLLTASSFIAHAQSNLYRYKDNRGLTVISTKIPARYIVKGYDIITSDGRLIKTVPPEPSAAEKEQILKERKKQERLKSLRQRYSNVDDIAAAKERKLAQSQNGIGIVERNIEKINNEISRLQSLAAADERAGRSVSQSTLDAIAQLKLDREKEQGNKMLREKEMVNIGEQFDSDIELFKRYNPQP